MEYKDYYQILGVSQDANEKEIKSAYRRLARELHPDVNPGNTQAEERFKEVNEAYEVLSDAEKRRKYDQLGSAWQDWQRGGGTPGDFDWNRWSTAGPGGQRVHVRYSTPEDLQDLFGGGNPFSDFFAQIFGGIGGTTGGFEYPPPTGRGQDLEQEVTVTLQEAFHGATRRLQKNGRRLQIKIPPGADNGTRIRLPGEGAPGASGGAPGDIYLQVQVAPDPHFERHGDDLTTTVTTDLYTAVLGGQVPVQTLSGPVTLTVPPNTQNGQTFRLRGKGMPRLRQPQEHGDLYVELAVTLPGRLTPRQRELFEELRRLSQEGR